MGLFVCNYLLRLPLMALQQNGVLVLMYLICLMAVYHVLGLSHAPEHSVGLFLGLFLVSRRRHLSWLLLASRVKRENETSALQRLELQMSPLLYYSWPSSCHFRRC